MTNRSIIEDYKSGITHQDFAVFYCQELDKHIVKRQPISDDERKLILSQMEINGLPPERYFFFYER
jgi:hypothetical protein